MIHTIAHFMVLCSLLLLLLGCTNAHYSEQDLLGVDEFVMDSYLVQQGKGAILEMEGKASPALSESLLEEYAERILEGDVLHVVGYHALRQDLMTHLQQIDERVGFLVSDGKITLPSLGPVHVAGRTLEEAARAIEAKYREEIQGVNVYVGFRDRAHRKVELLGAVQLPSVPVDGKMRLYEVLSLAKVAPQANLFKSYVVREGKSLPVDLYRLIKEGDMSQNIVLRPMDRIYIAESSAATVAVVGEVGKERTVDLPDGFMPLSRALTEAGGITSSADRAYIQVIRGGVAHPKIYNLHWEHVVRLPPNSTLLVPGDIVFVAAKPIVQWNRFVQQMVPTCVGIDDLAKSLKRLGVKVHE